MFKRRGYRPPEPPPRFARILNTVGSSFRVVKTIGSLVLLKSMAERMGLRSLVDSLIPMERESESGLTHGQVVESLVMNRCHAPVPLYEMEQWAQAGGMADFYGCSAERFNDDRMRMTLDRLPEHETNVQDAMALRLMNEFQVPADEVLYDITSLYFEGAYDESALIHLGYSRDQKPDKKQVNIALTVSRQGGVPLRSQTLSGETADPTTVEANVRALKKTLQRKQFLQITDGAMLTPANVHMLETEGISFLAPWRADTAILDAVQGDHVPWEPLAYRGAKGQDRYWTTELGVLVTYEEVLTDQAAPTRQPGQRGRLPQHPKQIHAHWERAVVVRSSSKQRRDEKTRIKQLQKLETALNAIQSGLNRQRLKTQKQVDAKLENLFSGPYAMYRRCAETNLDGPDGEMTFAWSWNPVPLERLKSREGLYVLLTNRKDSEADPVETLLERYKGRNLVESRIRDLKSHIKLHPLYVHTDVRVQALVLITVLALQLYSLIEWEAAKAQQAWTTSFLKKKFAQVSLLQTLHPDGTVEIEWCNLLPTHLTILKTLGLQLAQPPTRLAPFT